MAAAIRGVRLWRPPAARKAPAVRRAPARRVRCAGDVIPDLQALLDMACSSAAACQGVYVGTPEEQMRVVLGFYELSHRYDVSYGAAYVLRALLAHDLLTAVELARAFAAYKADLDVIHAAIDALPPLVSPDYL